MKEINKLITEIKRLSEGSSPVMHDIADQILHLCGNDELFTKQEVTEMLHKRYELDREDEI